MITLCTLRNEENGNVFIGYLQCSLENVQPAKEKFERALLTKKHTNPWLKDEYSRSPSDFAWEFHRQGSSISELNKHRDELISSYPERKLYNNYAHVKWTNDRYQNRDYEYCKRNKDKPLGWQILSEFPLKKEGIDEFAHWRSISPTVVRKTIEDLEARGLILSDENEYYLNLPETDRNLNIFGALFRLILNKLPATYQEFTEYIRSLGISKTEIDEVIRILNEKDLIYKEGQTYRLKPYYETQERLDKSLGELDGLYGKRKPYFTDELDKFSFDSGEVPRKKMKSKNSRRIIYKGHLKPKRQVPRNPKKGNPDK